MPINREARRLTHQLIHEQSIGKLIQEDSYDYEPKARNYAALARASGRLIADLLPDDPNLPEEKLQPAFRIGKAVGFSGLQQDLCHTIDRLTVSADRFLTAAAPSGHDDQFNFADMGINQQLRAGGETAVITMLGLLRQLPTLVQHHRPETDPQEYGAISKDSHRLAWDLAMLSVSQQVEAQSALSLDNSDWGHADHALRPEQFCLETNRQSLRLGYNDLPALRTTDQPDQTVGEMACFDSTTLGCPVTFMPQQFMATWHWMVELVEGRNLWDQTV